MSTELHDQIHRNMNLKETDELLDIWQTNARNEWSDEAMNIVKDILTARGVELPDQSDPADETAEEMLDDGLDEWEIKILEDENQPDFYDTVEVIDLKNKLNKTAMAAVVIYILQGVLYLRFYVSVVGSYFLYSERFIPLTYLLAFLLFILSTAISIAIVYYPLKALSSILRILMEMEFRSRKTI